MKIFNKGDLVIALAFIIFHIGIVVIVKCCLHTDNHKVVVVEKI